MEVMPKWRAREAHMRNKPEILQQPRRLRGDEVPKTTPLPKVGRNGGKNSSRGGGD